MKLRTALISAATALFAMTTIASAGPRYGTQEFYDSVAPNDSNVYWVDVIGDGYETYITLEGECYDRWQDIDLWVYENDQLLAKATSNGCFHQLSFNTWRGRAGTLKVVVENQKKPDWTDYTLIIE